MSKTSGGTPIIWFRRIIAGFLAFVFLVTLLPAMLVLRVNATAGNPGFYARQLKQADVYNYLHTSILPAAFDGAVPASFAWARPAVFRVAADIFPPAWMQAQAEQALNTLVPYMVGDTRSFSLTVPLKDRVEAAGSSFKSALRQGDTMNLLYERTIKSALSGVNLGSIPVQLSDDTIESMAQRVAPPDWALTRIDAAVDEVFPYLTMSKDHFSLNVDLSDRLDSLEAVAVDVLRGQEAHGYVLDYIGGAVKQQMDQVAGLPAGIKLTQAEIDDFVKQSFPIEWYQAQVPGLVKQIFDYLRGASQSADLNISLADRKAEIGTALSRAFEQKFQAWFDSLPVSGTGIIDFVTKLASGSFPTSRPVGVTYSQLKSQLGLDVAAMIGPVIGSAIPDQYRLSSPSVKSSLDQAKQYIQNGFVFTDKDLVKAMGQESVESVRRLIAGGIVFTDQDLRGAAGAAAQELEIARGYLGTFRRLSFLLWLVPLLLVAAVGALGGRRLASKLYWSGAALAAGAIIAIVALWPVFSSLAQPAIDQGAAQLSSGTGQLDGLLSAKAAVIVHRSAAELIGGLRVQSVVMLVLSAVLFGLGLFLDRRKAGARQMSPSATEET